MDWSACSAAEILERSRVLGVVGCSTNPTKAAYEVPEVLQSLGFVIIPVHPSASAILGQRAYRTLAEIPVAVDTVVVFRPSEQCAAVAVEAVAIGARAVWLQLGLVSPEARDLCHAAGLGYVEDACTKIVAQTHHLRKADR